MKYFISPATGLRIVILHSRQGDALLKHILPLTGLTKRSAEDVYKEEPPEGGRGRKIVKSSERWAKELEGK